MKYIYIEQLRNSDNKPQFLFYEHGQYSNPLFIMNQIELFELRKQIDIAISEDFLRLRPIPEPVSE